MGAIKKYYALAVEDKEASIFIFGDIVSWPWLESDVSSYTLVKEIESLPENIETINVFINSYGGEVAEGLAIYNVLRRHKAKVKTHCDGFACSAASVVFMAGDERIMPKTSLLFIHNAWLYTWGDPNELRKEANDLEIINAATVQAYMNHIGITEAELKEMMDVETWLSAEEALEKGFATAIESGVKSSKASQNMREKVAEKMLSQQAENKGPAIDLNGLAEKLAAQLKELAAVPEPQEPEPENKPKNLLAALFAAEKGS